MPTQTINANAPTNKVGKENSSISLSEKESQHLKIALAVGGLAGVVGHSKNPVVLAIGLLISSGSCLWALDKLNSKKDID